MIGTMAKTKKVNILTNRYIPLIGRHGPIRNALVSDIGIKQLKAMGIRVEVINEKKKPVLKPVEPKKEAPKQPEQKLELPKAEVKPEPKPEPKPKEPPVIETKKPAKSSSKKKSRSKKK